MSLDTTPTTSKPKRVPRTKQAVIALSHTLWLIAFLVSLASGIQIWLSHTYASNGLISSLRSVTLQGEVLSWHFFSGLFLSFALLAYILHLILTRDWTGLRSTSPEAKHRWLKRLNTMSLTALFLQVALGWVLLGEGNMLAREMVAKAHLSLACTLSFLVLTHFAMHAFNKGWLSTLTGWINLWRWRGTPLPFAIAVMLTIAIVISQVSWTHALVVKQSNAPMIDGHLDDEAWRDAQEIRVSTHNGNQLHALFNSQSTMISVKAVHDSERIYFALRWHDDSKSLAHLPLLKDGDIWRQLTNGFLRDDEIEFYEDKFAMMLSNASIFDAIRSIHLGNRVVSGAPAPRHERGYHFTRDGTLLDVWHWKATRTNSLFQADDNHFTGLYPVKECATRYKAGYNTDPKIGGGFSDNWRRTETSLIPKRLPNNSRFISADNALSEAVQAERFHMRVADSTPYSKQSDQIPSAHLIPAIVKTDSFVGDRGHVAARARWVNQEWQLELSRKLDTGSEFDQEIMNGTKLWFAPFDHAQTRHGYHLRPVELLLEHDNDAI